MERMGLGRGGASCFTHCSCVSRVMYKYLNPLTSFPSERPPKYLEQLLWHVSLPHLSRVFRPSSEFSWSCGVPYTTGGNSLLHVMDGVTESQGLKVTFNFEKITM